MLPLEVENPRWCVVVCEGVVVCGGDVWWRWNGVNVMGKRQLMCGSDSSVGTHTHT